MSELRQTLQPEYFDAIYSGDADPWKFATSPYERAKYTLTLNAMPNSRYARALEIGCSIGVLTRSLAARCDAVLAVDAAQTPLAEAKRRCADLQSVRFEQMFVPGEWPEGIFDLILLSEIVYYLSCDDVGRLAARVMQSLPKGGSVILVHWIGETDYPLSGDEAALSFIERVGPSCAIKRADRYRQFRLDVLSRS
jgi:cyclopropane fatty-acyl-phospholipid synthase-like methyltransferase